MDMVGEWFQPSEKYEFVNWDEYSQLNGKIKDMFQSPPISSESIGSFAASTARSIPLSGEWANLLPPKWVFRLFNLLDYNYGLSATQCL